MSDRPPAVRENLTRDDARQRAAVVGGVTTRVHLVLGRDEASFASETHLEFTLTERTATFVDLTADVVEILELDGEPLERSSVAPTRIELPVLDAGSHRLRVVATMAYQHEGKGLHRFVDPSDGRIYLHSQFEPFDAHRVYACFDQPDLKTVFELEVDAPREWVVVSNSAAIERPPEGEAGRWVFAPTPLISPYITAVVAGSYTSVHDVYRRDDGVETELGIYLRRSLAEYLDADEILEVTRQGLGAFERLFEQTYPFGKYDQLFVPEFSAGAMENPGCITFSEVYIFRSKVTDALRERRAETILHEMAHMWFGDLVTMRWWDDLWLNESFATFMSVLVQATATRWSDAWVTFLDAEKTWAKFQDQLPSTHPVADAMPDVESVHQNFDGITYAKGAAVLRQLVAWVGHEEFIAGCRDYFERHAWGNAELSGFLAALERTSGRDLAAWRDEWLLTTGLNALAARFEVDAAGNYTAFDIVQEAPLPPWAAGGVAPVNEPVLRRHRIAVGLYRRTEQGLIRDRRIELDVSGSATEVTKLIGTPAADVVVVNDDDLTYAKTSLDPATMDVVTLELARFVDPLPRALVWSSTWDMVRDAELEARRFIELIIGNVQHEDQIGVLQRLLARAVGAAERYADPGIRPELLARLAAHARHALDDVAPGSDEQLAWVRHWAGVARGDGAQLEDLRRLYDGFLSIEGLVVDTDLRWHLLTCLARAGDVGEAEIQAQLARDDTDLGQRQAATARAVRPEVAAKEAAWHLLLEDDSLSHTVSRHLWSGFGPLDQEELLAPFAERYFASLDRVWDERSLDWAIEFSSAMFPHHAASEALVERVDAELARPDLPRPLVRVLLEERDTLMRTLAARSLDRSAAGTARG
jgi:aminopeptidase N